MLHETMTRIIKLVNDAFIKERSFDRAEIA
jgi:hypothetical protein